MHCGRIVALTVGAATAAAVFVPAEAAQASPILCPYVVYAHSATAYTAPSTSAALYDVLPHNTRILATSGTVGGSGGPFRVVDGQAYVQTATLRREPGLCLSVARA